MISVVHERQHFSTSKPEVEASSCDIGGNQHDGLKYDSTAICWVELLQSFNVQDDAAAKNGSADPLKDRNKVEDISDVIIVRIDWERYNIEKVHHNAKGQQSTNENVELRSEDSRMSILDHKDHKVIDPSRVGGVADQNKVELRVCPD